MTFRWRLCVSPLRQPRSMSHRKSEKVFPYLPRPEVHHRLSKRQAPVKQAQHHENLATYKPAVQTLGGPQAWDACNRRCAGCDVLPLDLISRAILASR